MLLALLPSLLGSECSRIDPPNLCAGLQCPSTHQCNPQTGNCVRLNRCVFETCADGQFCNRATERCETTGDRCRDLRCPKGLACNPASQRCEGIDEDAGPSDVPSDASRPMDVVPPPDAVSAMDLGAVTDDGAAADRGIPLTRPDRVELDVGPAMNADVGALDVFIGVDAALDARDTGSDLAADVPLDRGVDAPVDVPSCPSGGSFCGGVCRSLTADDMNCGRCGVACSSAQRCVLGECRRRCGELIGPGGTTAFCGSGDTCVVDPAGGAGRVCLNYRCQPPLGVCDGNCIDLRANRLHCGACGSACPAGQDCVSGACRVTACANVMTDPLHCGSCTTVCPGDLHCIAGACACPTATLRCGDACVGVAFSDNNCGACGNACPPTQRCAAGTCVNPCFTGETACPQAGGGGPRCANLMSDSAHCGACGTACTLRTRCMSGVCR